MALEVSTTPSVRLTIGPLLYLWEPDKWRDFYFRIADEADVDGVTLGEVVCSKRQHFHQPLLGEVIERLTAGGKKVRLASLALVTLERELRSTRLLGEQDEFEVEVNEIAAHAAMRGKPHAVGPLVNVYNGPTARVLAAGGATSICLPPELPLASLRAIVRDAPGIEYEVFAFGRVPLAISARCAHARVKGATKDNCRFVCGEDPDGLPVETLDDQPFLALNGVQTMSHSCQALIGEVPELIEAGITSLRLSPQRCDMVAVAQIFRAVAGGEMDTRAGLQRLGTAYPDAKYSNGFLYGVPGHQLTLAR